MFRKKFISFHSLTQLIFIKHVLCNRHCVTQPGSSLWGHLGVAGKTAHSMSLNLPPSVVLSDSDEYANAAGLVPWINPLLMDWSLLFSFLNSRNLPLFSWTHPGPLHHTELLHFLNESSNTPLILTDLSNLQF